MTLTTSADRTARCSACFHTPSPYAGSRGAVVLCNPFGHEQVRCHRAYKILADALCRDGFHVLRFDYFGTGDSAGDGTEVSLAQWQDDLSLAIDELEERSGLRQVMLIGVRLGATLAVLAALKRHDVGELVLWDPVIDGLAYVRQMRLLHETWVGGCRGHRREDFRADVLGFPFPLALRRELDEMDLVTRPRSLEGRVIVFSSQFDERANVAGSLAHTLGPLAVLERVPEMERWDEVEVAHTTLPPQAVLRPIINWVRHSCREEPCTVRPAAGGATVDFASLVGDDTPLQPGRRTRRAPSR